MSVCQDQCEGACTHVDSNKINTVDAVNLPLSEYVAKALQHYLANLEGGMPANLYQMVLEQVEMPLLQHVMQYVSHNQRKAAQVLGISRITLHKKLKQYGFCKKASS
jgi:Fis family transcriptional regulator, factor for inversion stimulation protein